MPYFRFIIGKVAIGTCNFPELRILDSFFLFCNCFPEENFNFAFLFLRKPFYFFSLPCSFLSSMKSVGIKRAVVNFTIILRAAFFVQKFCAQLFWFVLFWRKNIGAKAVLKMLVKLNTDKLIMSMNYILTKPFLFLNLSLKSSRPDDLLTRANLPKRPLYYKN
jgi:hypothetical protein